jgi:phosphoglycerate dehydrogenase-like enzyme
MDIGVVQGQSLGFDGVRENLPSGLTYCNAVEVHEASTAELALGLVLASLRRIPEHVAAQSDSEWRHTSAPGLAGRHVLLIGIGGVGREIQQRLVPFDVELIRIGRTARVDAFGEIHAMTELPGLLPDADVVILAVPLSDETRHLVSTDFLDRMKQGALLVNVSRGPVVDTDALVDRVADGSIVAALDVTDPEPLPADHRLWRLSGVLITPHVGGHTGAMAGRMDRVIRDQIALLGQGRSPRNIVAAGSLPPEGKEQ